MANPSAVKLNCSQPDFLQFNNLACKTAGAKVIFATDEWFAPARNLLKREPPEFLPSAFTKFGKWMDGWETRRKRIPGHDWCIVQLGVPGVIHGFDVDTSFFTGNYAPAVSIQAALLGNEGLSLSPLEGDRTGMAASESQFEVVAQLHSESWEELVPVTQLKPGYSDTCHNFFRVTFPHRVSHIRVNMYPVPLQYLESSVGKSLQHICPLQLKDEETYCPLVGPGYDGTDGGIARLRVYGIGQRDWSTVRTHEEVDLVSLVNGGVCVGYSDAHYGHPRNIIGFGRADNMGDGWETARRLDRPKVLKVDEKGILQVPGFEWAIFRLGHPGVIRKIEIDTNHFKGNFPDWCKIEVCTLSPEEEKTLISQKWGSNKDPKWRMLLLPQKLKPHNQHFYSGESVQQCGRVSHVRLTIAPDGGVSRLRLQGYAVFDNTTKLLQTSKL